MKCRMRVGWIFLLATLVTSLAVKATEPELTAAERAQVTSLGDEMHRQCQTAIAQLSQSASPAPNEGLQKMLAATASESYCTCLSARIQSDIPVALVRQTNQDDLIAFLKSTANSCAVAQFKNAWPAGCRGMVQQIGSGSSKKPVTEQDVSKLCACVQPKIDALAPETLAETTRQTVEDYKDYQRDPATFMRQPADGTRPLSLAGAIRGCMATSKAAASH